MKKTCSVPFFCLLLLVSCSTPEQQPIGNLFQKVADLPSIEGKQQYLESPFVSAGDRVYIIGHQDGTFPDLGWHVAGEMGGIWNHPIKLMDGFTASLKLKGTDKSFCLNKAEKFINYPLANSHHYNWAEENLEVERIQSVPDGVEGAIIEFRIKNNSKENKDILFSFTGMVDLRPTWLGERTDMMDAADSVSFDPNISAVLAKDINNPWFVMFGSPFKSQFTNDTTTCPPPIRKGLGKNAELSWSKSIKANEEIIIPIFIAGSYRSEDALRNTYQLLTTQGQEKIKQKKDRYQIINKTARLSIPDKDIEQMYEWLKYNTEWLTRYVPEHGAGISAGLPDYPWWFGTDATYALQGVLATGNHELARNSILLLQQISQRTNKNGRIIHEVSTNGAVFNQGNVNETAQFITLVNNYFKWTGDRELVRQLFPELKKGIRWLLEEKDPDGNRYPNGSGMMEIPGLESKLELIDVAAYTQQAMVSISEMAHALGDSADAAHYRKMAEEVNVKINEEWWQPNENSFGDFIGTVEQATPILEAALVRTDTLGKTWAVAELKNTQKQMKKYKKGKPMPHVIYHNWVVNTPLETGIADPDKAQIARQKAKNYENAYGAFVTGIDRTEEADSVVLKSRKKIFSYTGAVMTLPTSVLAIAAARYGDTDDALQYIKKLNRSFSYALPGSMYEVSPDFGMITQAWNIYGVAVPIVQYFFGFQPKAYEKSIYLTPHLPAAWQDASLENVKVGNNYISLAVSMKEDHKEYRLQQLLEDWKIVMDVSGANKVIVNDKEVDLTTLIDHALTLKGKENKLLIH
jgi:glycogen debranching enzyme